MRAGRHLTGRLETPFDPNADGDGLIEEYFAVNPDFEDFEILAA